MNTKSVTYLEMYGKPRNDTSDSYPEKVYPPGTEFITMGEDGKFYLRGKAFKRQGQAIAWAKKKKIRSVDFWGCWQ